MNILTLSGALIGISSAAMAILVLCKNPASFISRLWIFFCILVAIWGFGCIAIGLSSNSCAALISWRVTYLGVIFIPAVFYHFVVRFLNLRRDLNVYLFYGMSASFLMLNTGSLLIKGTTWMFNEIYFLYPWGILYPFFVIYFFALVIISHFELWNFTKKTKNDLKRRQVTWFFIATGIGFTGGSSVYLPSFGVNLYPAGNFAVAAYPLIMTYAIFKHQLLDIKIVIQRTAMYSFWTLFMSGAYLLLLYLIQAVAAAPINTHLISNNAQNIFFKWSGFLALITNFGIGSLVFYKAPKNNQNRIFSLFSIFIGAWASGSWIANMLVDHRIALNILRINYMFGVFVPTLFLHFVVAALGSNKKTFVKIFYLQSIVLAILLTTPLFIKNIREIPGFNFFITEPGPVYYYFTAFFIVSFIIGFIYLALGFRRLSKEKSIQVGYIFAAYLVGAFGGLEYFLCVFNVIKRPPLDDYILMATFLILAYAIFKHGLMDIRIVIRRTLFYSLLAATISVFYVSLIFLLQRTFFSLGPISKKYLFGSLAFVITASFLLRPAEMALRRLLDRKFFRGTIEEIAEARERLESELERAERLKAVGVLAAGLAHEIKNPVTALKTFSEYLPQRYEDPAFRETLAKVMKSESERIERLVRNLLEFSKPSDPKKVACGMSEIVGSALDLMSGEMAKSRVVLEIRSEGDGRCMADPEQLKQAIINIILNAIEAMKPAGGKLAIFMATTRDKVELVIEDTGPGIPSDKLSHIFDPFYTDKPEGTGLGLAMTHSIIERNNGKIFVSSAEGQGARFTLSFPRHA